MSTTLVLDTCVLPQRGSVHSNPVLSALLRISAIRGFPVYISDVTRTESLNKRKLLAQAAIEKFGAAVREVSKIFGLDGLDYYIPSDTDAVEAWDQELFETFTILETDGEDAKEALHREASRTPPARETDSGSATGGRDSAIWLSTKRMHLTSSERTTYFISSNTKDFATSRNNQTLRSELFYELGTSADRFVYVSSLERAVELLAPSSDPQEVSFSELQELIQETNLEQQLLDALQASVRERELPQPISLSVNEVRERRAYEVETIRLAHIDIKFDCLSASWNETISFPIETLDSEATSFPVEATSFPVQTVHGKATAWLYQSNDNATFELDAMQFSDATFKIY
jgi:predicted nuclease of restriction endonuclease-like (RecB) superfamily